jgi:hypothetical protein
VFQIDPNGTVFIKSFGDQYNTTEGVMSTLVKGSSHTNVQEDWSLKVETGSGKVYINGDLDIECENFNVTARANMNLHAGVKTNVSANGISVLASGDDINVGAVGNIKIKAGTEETKGGFYVQSLHGDMHLDSYKANIFSETYTKISSKGTPAVSNQTVPYADAGHHGIEINSLSTLHLDAKHLSADGTTALSLNGGVIGIKSAGDIGIASTGGGTVGIDDFVKMANGDGTSTANSTFSTTDGARSTQKPNKSSYVSETEVVSVVSPGVLPASKAKVSPVIKRLKAFITGIMPTGEE